MNECKVAGLTKVCCAILMQTGVARPVLIAPKERTWLALHASRLLLLQRERDQTRETEKRLDKTLCWQQRQIHATGLPCARVVQLPRLKLLLAITDRRAAKHTHLVAKRCAMACGAEMCPTSSSSLSGYYGYYGKALSPKSTACSICAICEVAPGRWCCVWAF